MRRTIAAAMMAVLILLAPAMARAACLTHQVAILVRIIDGDTIDVTVRFDVDLWGHRRVRLARIDAPEKGQPGYAEAISRLASLLRSVEHFEVTVCKRDSFGRWIGEVRAAGINVSDAMLSSGHAAPYKE